jgi:glycosyltransferase involved in cell wall biosynthesis
MISVITNTYNRSEFLKEAIKSVLNQTHRDFEYIIVDNGSTDDTCNVIENVKDCRLKYANLSVNCHLSKARNRGLDEAKGNIVAFLDDDDFWHTDYLKELNTIYQDPNINSTVCNATIFNISNRYCLFDNTKLSTLRGRLINEYLLNDNFIVYTSCFSFRFIGSERMNEQLKYGESGFILKKLADGDCCVNMKELVYIRKHEPNISLYRSIDSVYIQGYFEEYINLDYLINNHLIDKNLYRKAYSHFLFKQAENLYSIGHNKKAQLTYLRSFLKYPLKIKGLVRSLKLIRFIG